MNKSRTKLIEYFWLVFFTVGLGAIIGIFIIYYPLVAWFGFEATKMLGFYSVGGGMIIYHLLLFLKRKLTK